MKNNMNAFAFSLGARCVGGAMRPTRSVTIVEVANAPVGSVFAVKALPDRCTHAEYGVVVANDHNLGRAVVDVWGTRIGGKSDSFHRRTVEVTWNSYGVY